MGISYRPCWDSDPKMRNLGLYLGDSKMNSKEAAASLGYAEKTLRESRVTGKLAGVTTPPYIKRGQRILYDGNDLLEWSSQFRKITNTAQSSI
jgi:hypothetical protein